MSDKCGIAALPRCQPLCSFVRSASAPTFHFKPPVCLASMSSRVWELRQPFRFFGQGHGFRSWGVEKKNSLAHSPVSMPTNCGAGTWKKTASLTRLFLCLYSAFRVFFYSSMVNDLARASAFCVARRASASCAAHRVECSAFGSAFGPCKWPVLGELPRALPTSAKARPRSLTLPRV